MKLFLGIVIVYNIINIAYSYYRYKKNSLSKWVVENLIFSFLMYINLLINQIGGYENSSIYLGTAACWLAAYAIVYVRKKLAK